MLSDELLTIALDANISVLDYWNMTPLEIRQTVDSYNRRHKQELKEKAIFVHRLADLTGMSVARLISKGAKYPSVEDAFPSLFESEHLEKEKQAMLAFAQRHNAARRQKDG